jgi:hypothetical protein
VGTATVVATNVTLGPGSGYAAQAGGQVQIVSLVQVSITSDGAPRAGVVVTARGSTGPVLAASGADGQADLLVESGDVTSDATVLGMIWTLTATVGDLGAEATEVVVGPVEALLALVPFVLSTQPVNGSTDVAATAPVSINFGLPMNRTATSAVVSIAPADPFDTTWDTPGTGLVLTPLVGWPAGTLLEITLGSEAETIDDLPLGAPYVVSFTVAASISPSTAPTVVSTAPVNGSAGANLNVPITIEFSEPMDPTLTCGAFSLVPWVAPAVGGCRITGASLLWVPGEFLSPGTTYEVTISTVAASLNGTPLAAPYHTGFTTAASTLFPTVVLWLPGNGSTLSTPPASIVLEWSVPMDPNSTAAAFSIYPAVAGAVRVNGSNLTWTALGSFQAGITYTVEVTDGALSQAGYVHPHPQWSVFLVRAASPSNGPAPGFEDLGTFVVGLLVGGSLVGLGVILVARARRRPGPAEPLRPS